MSTSRTPPPTYAIADYNLWVYSKKKKMAFNYFMPGCQSSITHPPVVPSLYTLFRIIYDTNDKTPHKYWCKYYPIYSIIIPVHVYQNIKHIILSLDILQ